MLTDAIEKSKVVFQSILTNKISDFIRQIFLQKTLCNVENFIKTPGNMKTHSRLRNIFRILNLFAGHPFFIRKSKIKTVTIMENVLRSKNVFYYRIFNMCYSLKCILHLLLLIKQLLFISHVLPFASSANTKMPALRFNSERRIRLIFFYESFNKFILLSFYFYFNNITGHYMFYKYCSSLPFSYTSAFISYVNNFKRINRFRHGAKSRFLGHNYCLSTHNFLLQQYQISEKTLSIENDAEKLAFFCLFLLR